MEGGRRNEGCVKDGREEEGMCEGWEGGGGMCVKGGKMEGGMCEGWEE